MFSVISFAQPAIELDANSFYQLMITSSSEDDGGKIYLQNLNLTPHLSMGSTNINFDVGPCISRTKEYPLVFLAEESVQMELKADGDLKIGNLAGLGDRPLFTTSDGTIKAGSNDHVVTISAYDFVSEGNPGDDQNFDSLQQMIIHENILIGTEILITPIQLPEGAIISRVIVFFRDNDLTKNVHFEIVERSHLSPGTPTIRTIGTSSGADSSVRQIEGFPSVFIDNTTRGYHLRAFNPVDLTDWPADAGIVAVNIFYTN